VVHVDRPPLDLTPAGVEATARAAAATWSRPAVGCTGFEVQMAIEQTDDAVVANDARNNLVFRRDSWAYDPQALAITTVFARQSDGVIVDGDLELNAVTFVWGDLAAGASGARTWDLQNTLTHELGHLLGLDHNCRFPGDVRALLDDRGAPVPECASAPPEIRESTMYPAVLPGDLERRTLAADDIAAVCGIYPLLGAGPCLPAADGGAQLGDAGSSAMAASLLLATPSPGETGLAPTRRWRASPARTPRWMWPPSRGAVLAGPAVGPGASAVVC
jgi:hypothetical protein